MFEVAKVTPEERKAERDRFDRLAVEFWKEYREAVRPICERYGMEHVVGGYEYDSDVEPYGTRWPGGFYRSIYSIEEELSRRES